MGKGWLSCCFQGLTVPATELENFLLSQGLSVYPTNLANLVQSRQGVPSGEDLLLCQPHLCFPSVLYRLLRQELRSQGLWLRAGRRGTDPLPVSSRAGSVLAQGSSCAACPPHATVSAPLSLSATAASQHQPLLPAPALPGAGGVPALSPWGPAGAGGTGGPLPPLQRGPSAQVLLRVARPTGRLCCRDTEQAIKHQRHQSSPGPGPATY